ncbi:MAG: hypothetical protein ACFCD0_06150 [Gemmataceae bacterium]
MTNATFSSRTLQEQISQIEASGFDPHSDKQVFRRLVWDLQDNVLKISYARRQIDGVILVQVILFLVGAFFVGVGLHMLYVVWTQPWGPGPENAVKESITPVGLFLVAFLVCLWAISQGFHGYELCVGPYSMQFRARRLFGTKELASLELDVIEKIDVKKSLYQSTRYVPQPGDYWGVQVTGPNRIEPFGVGLREAEVLWIQQTVLVFLARTFRDPGVNSTPHS